jgi:hypothetical protein
MFDATGDGRPDLVQFRNPGSDGYALADRNGTFWLVYRGVP